MGSSAQQQRQYRTHCAHGHEWTDENTYLRPKYNSPGEWTRFCVACQKVRDDYKILRRKQMGYAKAKPDAVRAAFAGLAVAVQKAEDAGTLIPCQADGVKVWEARTAKDQIRWCQHCPVKPECLALGNLDQHAQGVWGGKQMNLARGTDKPWAVNPNPGMEADDGIS